MNRNRHWSKIGQVELAERLDKKPSVFRRKASQFDGLRKCVFSFCEKGIMIGDSTKSLGRNSTDPIAHVECINRVLNRSSGEANANALDVLAVNSDASQIVATLPRAEKHKREVIARLNRTLDETPTLVESKPDKLEIKVGNMEITISFKE